MTSTYMRISLKGTLEIECIKAYLVRVTSAMVPCSLHGLHSSYRNYDVYQAVRGVQHNSIGSPHLYGNSALWR